MLASWRDAAISTDAPLHWEIHIGRAPRARIEGLIPQFDAPSDAGDSYPLAELPAWLAWYDELDRHGGDHTLVMLMEGDAIAAVCELVGYALSRPSLSDAHRSRPAVARARSR